MLRGGPLSYHHYPIFPAAPSAPRFFISSGHGFSSLDPLVAFDVALANAKIANDNLVKISSILPMGASRQDKIDAPLGSPIWTAYATVASDSPGAILATAVAVGLPKDLYSIGVIMETSATMDQTQKIITSNRFDLDYRARELASALEAKIKQMTESAMHLRDIPLKEVIVSSTFATVPEKLDNPPHVSLISAVCIW